MNNLIKFNVGDIVRLKRGLEIGATYYNVGKTVGDTFTIRMRSMLKGKEAKIIEILNGGYILDIDNVHIYYDDMIERPRDRIAEKPYLFNEEVEKLVEHMTKQHYTNMIDKALEERMFESDPERFQRLLDLYMIKN